MTTRWQKHAKTKAGIVIEQTEQLLNPAEVKKLHKLAEGSHSSAQFHLEVMYEGPKRKKEEVFVCVVC